VTIELITSINHISNEVCRESNNSNPNSKTLLSFPFVTQSPSKTFVLHSFPSLAVTAMRRVVVVFALAVNHFESESESVAASFYPQVSISERVVDVNVVRRGKIMSKIMRVAVACRICERAP
jgi:hypothetical protein